MIPRHDVYHALKYESLDRWISYYRQIHELLALKPENILEIGKGSGLVETVLRFHGARTQSLDIDPILNPDIVGSVTSMPVPDKAYDVTLCAEVLEHLPFEDFSKALSEIRRVTKRAVVLSLPHWGWTFSSIVKIPLLPRIEWCWKLDGLLSHPPGGDHAWEIGKRGFPLRRIRNVLEASGFRIRKTYLRADSPYHRFFILDVA